MRRFGTLTVAALLGVSLAVMVPAASAKKKGGGAVNITKAVNAPIPDALPPPPLQFNPIVGSLTSTIDVGTQFQGRKIRDVNVTVQTLGLTGNNPAFNLSALLTAPNGATSQLFFFLSGFGPTNPSIGPLTLDDEARLLLGGGAPDNPNFLFEPWGGAAQPIQPLAPMDNGPVRGTWTLAVEDIFVGDTSSLVSWRLNVVAGKPFKTK